MIERRVKKLVGIAMAVVFLAPLLVFAVGEAGSHLWNWLMPELFGLRTITFWQALGLMFLGRLLIGGFGWGGRRRRYVFSDRMSERWEQMTPEQRASFREGIRGRCGFDEPPVVEPKA